MPLWSWRKKWLKDVLPWGGMLAPGIGVTTSGVLHKTWALRGPDMERMTESALLVRAAQLNHLFMRYGFGWGLHFEAQRHAVRTYAPSLWPNAVTRLLDDERATLFAEGESHFDTQLYVTLLYVTPREGSQHIWHYLYERGTEETKTRYEEVLEGYQGEAALFAGLLTPLFPTVHALDNDETFSYLHSCVSTNRQKLQMPRLPVFLSHHVVDQEVDGGEEPRLGEAHLRVLSIYEWPHGELSPNMLSVLDDLPLEFRLTVQSRGMDREQARHEAHVRQRRWLQKRKGLLTMLREEMTKQPSDMQEPEAKSFAQDAVEAQDAVAQGLYTFSRQAVHVMVWDRSYSQVKEKVELVQRTLHGEGFTTMLERQGALQAWLVSMPGTMHDEPRSEILSSDNLADVAPTTSIWSGQRWNAHLQGNPLCYATTGLSTPFGLVLHDQDVAHFAMIGPNGSGKDMALWFFALQFLKYPRARIFAIDKGHGSRVATAAVGGTYEALGTPGSYAAQPLAHIDDERERAWAQQWLLDILRDQHVAVTPDGIAAVFEALKLVAGMPRPLRTMTGFCLMLQDPALRAAFTPYTQEGAYGTYFDGDQDGSELHWWHVLAMDEILKLPAMLPAMMDYRMHCVLRALERRDPTMILVNEIGEYGGYPRFIGQLDSLATQIRKLNGSLGIATQSINRVTDDIMKAASNEIPNRFMLPNFHAMEAKVGQYYEDWGYNERERQIIAAAIPKKHYYYTCRLGARLLDFQFGPVAVALCGSGSGADLAKVDELMTTSPEQFAAAWLDYKGLPAQAEALRQDPYAHEEDEAWERRNVLARLGLA
jgi:type IV secretory pathway VirB4 component